MRWCKAGASLEDQWTNGIAQTTIGAGPWTHVVIQGQSIEPLTAIPGNAGSTFQTYAKKFADLATAAGAKPTFFATWARAAADPIYSPLPAGDFTCPAQMQDELTIAYAQAAQAAQSGQAGDAGQSGSQSHTVLACVGEAFKRAIALHPEITLQQSDESHPTVAGTYLAASTFYVALTGNPVPQASVVPAGVSADDAAALRDIARVGTDCSDVHLKGAIATTFPTPVAGAEPIFGFGTAGLPLTTSFTLTNTGGVAVGIQDALSLAPPFAWTGNGGYPGGSGADACGASLAPAESCTISVTYAGTSSGAALGASTKGDLKLLFTGDTYLPSASCALVGTATSRAFLTISDEEGFFACMDGDCAPPQVTGSPGGTRSQDFFVVNRGAEAVTVSSAGTPLAAPFGWAGGAFPGGTGSVLAGSAPTEYAYCGGPLGVGATCVVTIQFSPLAPGMYNGAVNIAYSDASGPAAINANRNVQGISGQPLPL